MDDRTRRKVLEFVSALAASEQEKLAAVDLAGKQVQRVTSQIGGDRRSGLAGEPTSPASQHHRSRPIWNNRPLNQTAFRGTHPIFRPCRMAESIEIGVTRQTVVLEVAARLNGNGYGSMGKVGK